MNFDIGQIKSAPGALEVYRELAADGWRQDGKEYRAKVPWRKDEHGSLTVNEKDGCWLWADITQKQFGDVISFVRQRFGYDFRQAMEWLSNRLGTGAAERRIKKIYDYQNEKRITQHQTIRYEPKGFSQRHPDGKGGWIWNLEGVELVLYRLPELIAADPRETVWIVEGEKDVESLRQWNLIATCNPMGANKWKPAYNAYLKGRSVVVVPDQDKSGEGQKSGRLIHQNLKGVASEVYILNLPNAKDVTEWIEKGGTKQEFIELPVEEGTGQEKGLGPAIRAMEREIADYRSGKIVHLPLPWPGLNSAFMNRGIPSKTLGLLVSLTGEGKTWFTYHLALCVAGHQMQQSYPVYVINSEMTLEMMLRRLCTMISGQKEFLGTDDPKVLENMLYEHGETLLKLPLTSLPPESRSPEEVLELVLAQAATHKLIIIDHINDLRTEKKLFQELPRMAVELRNLARRMGIAVLLVSHLKAGEISDIIANSRLIENEVDYCFSLHHIDAEQRATVTGPCGTDPDSDANCYLTIRKNRVGLDRIRLAFYRNEDSFCFEERGRLKALKKIKTL